MIFLKVFKSSGDQEEFKSFYKIENIQNTDLAANININKKMNNLGFKSNSPFFNDQFTLMDFGEITGLEDYSKTELK